MGNRTFRRDYKRDPKRMYEWSVDDYLLNYKLSNVEEFLECDLTALEITSNLKGITY